MNMNNTTYDDQSVIDKAIEILDDRIKHRDAFTSVDETKKYIRLKLSGLEHEVFSLMLLDSRHHLIDFVELFRGTIDGAAIYPREVLKMVLKHNAAAVIFAHNHPSGNSRASRADKSLTKRLKTALDLINVRVLDHIIIGDGEPYSFSEQGIL